MERKIRLRYGVTRVPRNLSRQASTWRRRVQLCSAALQSQQELCEGCATETTSWCGGVRQVAHEAFRSTTDRTDRLRVRRGYKLAGAEQDHQYQQRARRHSSRTRLAPCQQDFGRTRLGRFQEREDASRLRNTLADRTARLWSRRQQRSTETVPCVPTWLQVWWR